MTSQESIEHAAKMRAVRDEFNAIWRVQQAEISRTFGSQMTRAEMMAWEFFKLGKTRSFGFSVDTEGRAMLKH